MNVRQLKQSKYLTRGDVGAGILVTIKETYEENLAIEGDPDDMKWLLSFEEHTKPMVLNTTNGLIIAQIVGSEEFVDWPGHKIVLYYDPTVMYKGKVTGGIRCRAPRNQPKSPSQGKPGPITAQSRPNPGPAATQPGRQPPIVPVDPGPANLAEEDPNIPF